MSGEVKQKNLNNNRMDDAQRARTAFRNRMLTCHAFRSNRSATMKRKFCFGEEFLFTMTLMAGPLLINWDSSRAMGGEPAPEEWKGDLETYSLGPNFKTPGWVVKMEVLTQNKMATIYNTIGVLRGEEEPGKKKRRRLYIDCLSIPRLQIVTFWWATTATLGSSAPWIRPAERRACWKWPELSAKWNNNTVL